jgi:hypothetical protein
MDAVSCDSVSDFAVLGLLNWQADGMFHRLQCCIVRKGDGFGRQVKCHIENAHRKSAWPRYYDLFVGVAVKIGKDRSYYSYDHLKAHVDVIGFSMFTFDPHELRATGGVAKWVLHDRRLEGVENFVFSVNRLLLVISDLAFVYPMQQGNEGGEFDNVCKDSRSVGTGV